MLLAFGAFVARLDARYASSKARAPEGFDERLHFWRDECGMDGRTHDLMQTLRIWSNAARHHDHERWRRDGPRSAEEASRHVAAIEAAVVALERGQ